MQLSCNSMDHERFGELSALAATGQITPLEYAQWRAHLDECASCRTEYAALADVVLNDLPLMHPQRESTPGLRWLRPKVTRYEERFIARARAEGFRLSDEGRSDQSPAEKLKLLAKPYAAYSYGLLVVFLVMAVVLGYRLRQSVALNQSQAKEIARLKEQVPVPLNASPPRTNVPTTLPDELSQSRAEASKLAARMRELDQQLNNAASLVKTLRAEITAGKTKETNLWSSLQAAEQNLAQTAAELQNVRDKQAQDAMTLSRQQARLDQLEEKLATQGESVERSKRLLAADRDIRDLMGARNLHIIDVLDVDSRGRTKRPFGRVFYTEGKSLIFYAFDLGSKEQSPTEGAFQAWGFHEPDRQSVQSLGIFYQDDQTANRWILKFEDPDVLAEIDSVFVTTEPPGGSKRPSGRRLLYAYLNVKINHP